MTILTLLKLLKPIKTDRKSIVDSGSLDITSGSLLKWPFMPKQGPRSKVRGTKYKVQGIRYKVQGIR